MRRHVLQGAPRGGVAPLLGQGGSPLDRTMQCGFEVFNTVQLGKAMACCEAQRGGNSIQGLLPSRCDVVGGVAQIPPSGANLNRSERR